MIQKTNCYVLKQLGDILDFKNGKSIKPGGIGKYPVYGSNGIIGGCEEHKEQNGIILGRVGAYCGSVSYYPGKFWASDNTIVVYPKNSEYDVLFLSYLLRELNLNRWAGGAAQPLLTQGVLKQVETPVPPLPTQRKIASILAAYDDLIEKNLRRIKILEEMAQSLYREWFVKFRFPGHEKVRMVDSPLGKIPEGWEVKMLGELADQVRDSVDPESVDPETAYFGLEHLPRKSITLADWGLAREVQSTKLLFDKGDILFGKIRPYFHKVGVAPLPGICSSDTIVIRPKAADWFGLVLGCSSSEEFVEHATATSQGTKMPRANWDVLVKYQIYVSPNPVLGRFNEFVSGIVSQLHNFVFRNKFLRQTRDLLLPKLISGELDVSELDISIPEEAA